MLFLDFSFPLYRQHNELLRRTTHEHCHRKQYKSQHQMRQINTVIILHPWPSNSYRFFGRTLFPRLMNNFKWIIEIRRVLIFAAFSWDKPDRKFISLIPSDEGRWIKWLITTTFLCVSLIKLGGIHNNIYNKLWNKVYLNLFLVF